MGEKVWMNETRMNSPCIPNVFSINNTTFRKSFPPQIHHSTYHVVPQYRKMSTMCDSFSFAQEMPALDVSPTIPTMVLPGWGDKEEDQQVYFLPDMPANKNSDTARRSTNFTTDMDLGSLIAQDAFPSFILDVIDLGSVHTGTKARETRLGELPPSQSTAVHPTNIISSNATVKVCL